MNELGDTKLPRGLSPETAWRWCLRDCIADLDRSAARNRLMSQPVLERLFTRRWNRLARRCQPVPAPRERARLEA
ncbi:MAG: hypothetical protein ACOCTI_04065, partial [Phycisphaeraceae bacterium]